MNSITWFELPAVDMDRAVGFYTTVLGRPMHREVLDGVPHGIFSSSSEGVGGTLVVNPDRAPSENGIVIYLHADNLDDALSRVADAGGTVRMPKQSIPQGVIAWILDTEGNLVGLHEPLSQN